MRLFEVVLWILAGAVLAAALVWFAGRGGTDRRLRLLAVGLLVAALVYVPLALVAGEQGQLLVELAGVGLFAAPAYLGARGWVRLLAAGWVAHMLWDVGLHMAGPAYGPAWYAALCIGFDLVVAGGLLLTAGAPVRVEMMRRAGTYE